MRFFLRHTVFLLPCILQSFEYVSVKANDDEKVSADDRTVTPLHGTPILIFYNNIDVQVLQTLK